MVDIHKQKVVVIGHGTTSRLSLIRSIAELGCEISVVVMTWYKKGSAKLDLRKSYDCHSKYVTHLYPCYAKDGKGLIRILLEKCTDSHQKVILFPDSDFTTAIIDDNQEKLSPFFLFPSINHIGGAIKHWMNKDVQKVLAREVGLNVPMSHIAEVRGGRFTIPDEVVFPCFTKAVITINGGKNLFKRCYNKDELEHHLEEISRKFSDVSVLVEDYKEIINEYAVVGFSDGKEVIIPGIIGFLRNTVSHFGVAMTGQILPISGFEGILKSFEEFVLRIGYVGLFDVDFYDCGGKLYFGEMNFRFGGSGYAMTKLGVNLPAMLIRFFRGEDYSYLKKGVDGIATYVNERMCEDDWCKGVISSSEYRQLLSKADISFVRDKSDPSPYRTFRRIHYASAFKKLFDALRKR